MLSNLSRILGTLPIMAGIADLLLLLRDRGIYVQTYNFLTWIF